MSVYDLAPTRSHAKLTGEELKKFLARKSHLEGRFADDYWVPPDVKSQRPTLWCSCPRVVLSELRKITATPGTELRLYYHQPCLRYLRLCIWTELRTCYECDTYYVIGPERTPEERRVQLRYQLCDACNL